VVYVAPDGTVSENHPNDEIFLSLAAKYAAALPASPPSPRPSSADGDESQEEYPGPCWLCLPGRGPAQTEATLTESQGDASDSSALGASALMSPPTRRASSLDALSEREVVYINLRTFEVIISPRAAVVCSGPTPRALSTRQRHPKAPRQPEAEGQQAEYAPLSSPSFVAAPVAPSKVCVVRRSH
ncbi:hypothetical protein KIPB_016065, partial [Kipferlia bialata]